MGAPSATRTRDLLPATEERRRRGIAPDRAQQTVRAAGAMMALIGLTLAFEWAAVIGGANSSQWGAWTSWQVGGLAPVSMLAVGAAVLLARCRRPRGSSAQWRNDWFGDIVLVCHQIPVLRRWATPEVVAWFAAMR